MAIDRKGGPTVAKETVKLAKEFFLSAEDTVLGLDLSGDPTVSYDIVSPNGRISGGGLGWSIIVCVGVQQTPYEALFCPRPSEHIAWPS